MRLGLRGSTEAKTMLRTRRSSPTQRLVLVPPRHASHRLQPKASHRRASRTDVASSNNEPKRGRLAAPIPSMFRSLLALAAAAQTVGAETTDLTLIDQSTHPTARCMDGTPPGFYARAGVGESFRSTSDGTETASYASTRVE